MGNNHASKVKVGPVDGARNTEHSDIIFCDNIWNITSSEMRQFFSYIMKTVEKLQSLIMVMALCTQWIHSTVFIDGADYKMNMEI